MKNRQFGGTKNAGKPLAFFRLIFHNPFYGNTGSTPGFANILGTFPEGFPSAAEENSG
jgi:hypothetical protein